jgi:hypothetical protein
MWIVDVVGVHLLTLLVFGGLNVLVSLWFVKTITKDIEK